MSFTKVPKPTFISAEETSITFEVIAEEVQLGVKSYDVYYKQHAQPWDVAACKTIDAQQGTKDKVVCTLEELIPGTPYCIRIVVRLESNETSEPGPEMVVDTASIDCNNSGPCCTIQ
mmetsp:Transcript_9827/g.11507  ORF Transcript_9827/g.11507 Transcript_9827/m.11507 type:complete len:117 (+) Transcript_9827:188-538(+)